MSVSYSTLLKTNKNFNKLFYGQTLSVLGDWFHTVALLTFVYSITESPFMIVLTFISKSLPQLLLSPFIGGIVDRFSKEYYDFYRYYTGNSSPYILTRRL